MVGTEVDNKPDILSCSVGVLFVGINYTAFDRKEGLLEEILRSREISYHYKDIVYAILPPKIVVRILVVYFD